MSSLTKTPAQESASADSAASVPAQASTSTTESTLSVDEYHALQYKERVGDKAIAPKTILMSADYGSDISVAPMEDGEVPSSAADYKLVVNTPDPVTEAPSAVTLKLPNSTLIR
ncbi:hypothetical protein JG688_00017645 [Phytophthora aleatoria]|uniref:Uncharacterized protein n=1 Tax=Phytophthora aleatoria TaxID=2496075 RepID=A0A8J5I2W7_9STRA|nr:hypothetical protein JG688_00017645 [Phytophthora aleatoria]